MEWTGDITKTGGEGQEIQTKLSHMILTASAEQLELTVECGKKPTFKSVTQDLLYLNLTPFS
jgi:hypothetical protein